VLSGLIADIVIKNKSVKEDAKKFRRDFLEMKFCLPPKEAIPLASNILKSAFASPGFVDMLRENLEKNI
jgi:hypothetical protein